MLPMASPFACPGSCWRHYRRSHIATLQELTFVTDALYPLRLPALLKVPCRADIYENRAVIYIMEAIAMNKKLRMVTASGRRTYRNGSERRELRCCWPQFPVRQQEWAASRAFRITPGTPQAWCWNVNLSIYYYVNVKHKRRVYQ